MTLEPIPAAVVKEIQEHYPEIWMQIQKVRQVVRDALKQKQSKYN